MQFILTKLNVMMKIFSVLFLLSFIKISAQTDTIQTNVPALKNVFKNDFYIGCLLSYRNIGLPTDPPVTGQSSVVTPYGGYLVKYQMNSMSPGNNMKPQYTVDLTGSATAYNAATGSAQDSIDTHPIIKFNGDIIAQLNWAQRQGFTFRGHTLVWYNQTPGTGFFRTGYSATGTRLTKDRMTSRLENYIKEVIRLIHQGWPGLLSAFDVVNEALEDNGTDRTSESEWYVTFGDNSYIAKAFEFARKYTTYYGETQIKLYYNDYNTGSLAAKADGVVRICTPIFQAGNLDGIGMQEHDNNTSPTAAQWISSYNKFSPICTEIAVTEFDCSTGSSTPSSTLLTQQANQYGQLFKCFVERSYKSGRGKVINVTKDGLNDAYTMTTQASSLWDAHNQCKPAFYAVADVGTYYNKLDSLVTYTTTLKQSDYTAWSWSNYSTVLSSSITAKNQNYDYSTSAATALKTAFTNLNNSVKSLIQGSTGISADNNNLPKEFSLSQNYPNPFNPSTQIKYSVPKSGYVSLKVFNLLGQEVATLYEGFSQPGNYVVVFDGSKFASGVYFYRLKSDEFSTSKKLILMK